MAIDFSTDYYMMDSAITLSDADFAFVFVAYFDSAIGAGLHYIASSDFPTSGTNRFNLWVTNTGATQCEIRGPSVVGNATGNIAVDTPVLVVCQRRGTAWELWSCKLNEPVELVASVSISGIGGFAMNTMRLGARIESVRGNAPPADRQLDGVIYQFAYLTARSLRAEEMNAIAAGADINDLGVFLGGIWYKPEETTGNAPSTLTDLIGSADATLESGTPVNTANANYGNYSIVTSGSGAIGYSVKGDSFKVNRWNIHVSSTDAGSDVHGIRNTQYDNCEFDGLRIRVNAPAAHGIRIGTFGGSAITGGKIINSWVSGPVYASNTPHGITSSTNTSIIAKNNIVHGLHVGLLMSNCNDITTGGNIFVDNNGPAMYMKGTVDANPSYDTVIQTGAVQIQNNGLLAAVDAEGTDCVAGDFSDILVIVYDMSKIKALAQIGGLSATPASPQPVTFTRCKFIIPNDYDYVTNDIFIYTGAIGQAANRTWAEWDALTETVNNELIPMPKPQIKELINDILADKIRTLRSGYSAVI